MPTPTIAALVAERGIVKSRLHFPTKKDKKILIQFFLIPIIVVGSIVVIIFLGTVILGNLLHLYGVGEIITNMSDLKATVVDRYGSELAATAKYPPSIVIMWIVTFFVATLAGWSINGVVALGEEYGWRGFLWENWKHLGIIPANIIIGFVWGLWHAPLIFQGYNYPGQPIGGVLMMIVFTISSSFTLSAVREMTNSVLPVAATHGAINGVAGLLFLMIAHSNQMVGGILGILGCVSIGIVATVLWLIYIRRKSKPSQI
jgi:membrane protease YdiL (CAAX protease family)